MANKTIKLSKNNIILIILLTVLFILSVTIISLLNSGKSQNENTAAASGGDLVIPADKLTNKPSFFAYNSNGTKMEVIALRTADNKVRTAFNTCQVCYNSGRGYYKLEGNNLVCQNCGNTFTPDQVEQQQGGCNPVPITDDYKQQSDNNIVISQDFLQKASVIFKSWKK